MATMTQEQVHTFLDEPHVGHLVTLRPSGSPHVAPIWYEYRDGRFLIWTSRETRKVKNILGDGRAALSIATDSEPYKYVTVEGTASVSETDVKATGISIASRYQGRERGTAFIAEHFKEGVSVVLSLVPDNLVAWTDEA